MKSYLSFIILCLILFVYLGLKTLPENGWTGWGVFSAQTLLNSEHWVKDGFINSKFLFIPIGYSKIVQYLDDSAMRHHARGTTTGELIGKRLYYTHYPSGYLFPYALLMKAGVSQRHWFRLLALSFSFFALILLYYFFSLIAAPTIAFLAILYYGISTMFLDYADSLANQPLDDLFRAIILVLSVLAVTRPHTKKVQTFYDVGVWFFYFLLSISSYDSTFFVFIWLIGLDIVIQRKFLWKKWLFFASASILAFGLQMLQNWWYLGWKDFWLDLKGSFLFRTSSGPGGNFLEKHIRSMFSPLAYMIDLRIRFALPIILVVAAAFAYLTKLTRSDLVSTIDEIGSRQFKFAPILIVLFLAGLAYALVFVSSGYFPYQGRQWMPWFSLLLASSTVLLWSWRPPLPSLLQRNAEISKAFLAAFFILLITVMMIWIVQANRTFAYIKDWPNHKVDFKIIDFYKYLKSQTDDGVIFYIDNNFKNDYPQPDPIEEYYAGMTILNFKNFQDLLRDYQWLKNKSKYPFDAIVVSPQKELVEGIKQALLLPGEIKFVTDKYVLY